MSKKIEILKMIGISESEYEDYDLFYWQDQIKAMKFLQVIF